MFYDLVWPVLPPLIVDGLFHVPMQVRPSQPWPAARPGALAAQVAALGRKKVAQEDEGQGEG